MTISGRNSITKMYSLGRIYLLAATFLSPLLLPVNCLQGGILGCGKGTDALLDDLAGTGNPHADYTQVGGGPLSDYNLTMMLNGKALDQSAPAEFEVKKDHNLTLIASGTEFSGFLVRMDSTNEEDYIQTDAILPIERFDPITNMTTTGGSKQAAPCISTWLVAGVSHDSPSKKTVVELHLNMDTATENLVMDVTVVARASPGEKISEWYFSSYTLNAIPAASVPTLSPTARPTKPLTSEVPTATPVSSGTHRNKEVEPWFFSSYLALIVVMAYGI